MNILVICHYGLYKDLSFSFVHNQAKEYAKLGHQVRVLVPVPIGKRAADNKRVGAFFTNKTVDGVEICYMRFLSWSNYGELHFNAWSARCMIRCIERKLLKNFVPDVIHANTIMFDGQLGVWLKHRLKCPLVITTHGSDTFVPLKLGQGVALKRICDQADKVVAVSSMTRRELKKCGTLAPMCVILNGFMINNIKHRNACQPLHIIQVGSLIERKKVDVTIKAFAQLIRNYSDATLMIVGDGPKRKDLEKLCCTLGLGESVIFAGQLDNKTTLAEMAKAQFFVMPSVREGFGIVYLEAMASGCITIGTEGEGISDLIKSGNNGFLVPADNPESITEVITMCLNKPDKAKKIAKRGQSDANALTWERNAGCYITIFGELCTDGD